MVSGSEEIHKALEDRLNEIKREQRAEWAAFEADPEHLEVPTDSPQRLDELESIHTAIAREQQVMPVESRRLSHPTFDQKKLLSPSASSSHTPAL